MSGCFSLFASFLYMTMVIFKICQMKGIDIDKNKNKKLDYDVGKYFHGEKCILQNQMFQSKLFSQWHDGLFLLPYASISRSFQDPLIYVIYIGPFPFIRISVCNPICWRKTKKNPAALCSNPSTKFQHADVYTSHMHQEHNLDHMYTHLSTCIWNTAKYRNWSSWSN